AVVGESRPATAKSMVPAISRRTTRSHFLLHYLHEMSIEKGYEFRQLFNLMQCEHVLGVGFGLFDLGRSKPLRQFDVGDRIGNRLLFLAELRHRHLDHFAGVLHGVFRRLAVDVEYYGGQLRVGLECVAVRTEYHVQRAHGCAVWIFDELADAAGQAHAGTWLSADISVD